MKQVHQASSYTSAADCSGCSGCWTCCTCCGCSPLRPVTSMPRIRTACCSAATERLAGFSRLWVGSLPTGHPRPHCTALPGKIKPWMPRFIVHTYTVPRYSKAFQIYKYNISQSILVNTCSVSPSKTISCPPRRCWIEQASAHSWGKWPGRVPAAHLRARLSSAKTAPSSKQKRRTSKWPQRIKRYQEISRDIKRYQEISRDRSCSGTGATENRNQCSKVQHFHECNLMSCKRTDACSCAPGLCPASLDHLDFRQETPAMVSMPTVLLL